MPGTLRRKHRQELTLRRSLMEVMQAKLSISVFRRPSDQHSPRPPDNRRRDPCAEHRFKVLPPAHRSSATSYTSTHSIRNLPPELLAYIFVLGCEDDPMLPLSVSHVCSFWRALALDTPVLWRRVVLGSHYSMWEETMYRARDCTLDIEFKPQNHRGPLAFYEVQRYMHLVMPHITRWRSLSIVFSEYQPYLWNSALSECCTKSNYTQVPGLEELCLVYRHNDDTKEFCLFSGFAPKLRRVTLDGIRLTWLPSLFQNLTYLDYTHHGKSNGYHAIQEIGNVLRVSSRLIELRLLFPNQGHITRVQNTQTSLPFGSLYLPWLRALHLRVETRQIPEELVLLASIFTTPRLSELLLIDTVGQRLAFRHIDAFWSAYTIPFSLRTLHLQNGWYTEDSVVFLSRVENLRWLVLRRGCSDVVHWLNPDIQRSPERK
ncbi:MAG: hypothetical protein NXY57DRAFT_980785 [Lentinula lateritia]|nr:MAG: hypothetical protein NXY57DRAFT_980785 [Lentinula lateritia]